MRRFFSVSASYFRHWFPKRNIIIVSERKVKHLHIGGKTQFTLIAMMISGVCWASYSTGSFFAAQSTLQQQGQTLRSVASARIATNFSNIFPTSVVEKSSSRNVTSTTIASLNDPMYSLSALDHNKLFARIAFLEHQVIELKNANDAMIQRVNDKTLGHISDIESIIRQTGLHVEDLKREYNEKQSKDTATDNSKSEGGPYIPANTTISSRQEYVMYDNLDKLTALRNIIVELPIGMPIAGAEPQSPFGHRIDPFTGHLAFHSGLDLAGPIGSKIYSTAEGKVVFAGINGGYGNSIDIDHGYGIITRYGHLSQILVDEGQTVHKGDIIGVQGSTGRSTGPHLHYEVRYHDQPMNPSHFLDAGHYVSQN
jgi:murein DD-endopeptidase MepM/ murein hydrolase activator NlpD